MAHTQEAVEAGEMQEEGQAPLEGEMLNQLMTMTTLEALVIWAEEMVETEQII